MGTRKLYRIPSKGMIAGVCTGLAQYLRIDLILIRAAFILLSFVGFSGIILYIFLWLFVPIKPAKVRLVVHSESPGYRSQG